MATQVSVTVDTTGGHDYTTLSGAIAGELGGTPIAVTSSDLVTNNEELTIYCQGSTADTVGVVVSGFTTDATHRVIIKTTGANRLAGQVDTSLYRLVLTAPNNNANALTLTDNFIVIDGIQVEIIAGAYTGCQAIASAGTLTSPTTAALHTVDSCLVKSNGAYAVDFSNLTGTGQKGYLMRSVLACTAGTPTTGIDGAIVTGARSAGNYGLAYRNTIYGFGVGIRDQVYKSLWATANVVNNCTTCYGEMENSASTSDYNLSSDATAVGANAVLSTSLTFGNPSSYDFSLASSDTAAIGAGVDLSTDTYYPISTDIAGVAIGSPADIGAFEYVIASSVQADVILGI